MSYPLSRTAFLLLVILAVLTRAFIPAGFMPEAQGGKIAITICHGADLQTIFVDAPVQPTKPAKGDCPFSPIAQSDAGADYTVTLAALPVTYMVRLDWTVEEVYATQRAHAPGNPRAPPALI